MLLATFPSNASLFTVQTIESKYNLLEGLACACTMLCVRGTSTNKLLFERLNLHDRYKNEKHAKNNLVSPGVHMAARKATTTDALLS